MYLHRFLYFLSLFICNVMCFVGVVKRERILPDSVLDYFKNEQTIKYCDIAFTDPDIAVFLHECNVTKPVKNEIDQNNVKSFLCMAYFDISLKICYDSDLKSQVPVNKTDFDGILKVLDSKEIAQDFCKKSHLDLVSLHLQTSSYMDILSTTLSDPDECKYICLTIHGKLNEFCKIILWGTEKLKNHQDLSNDSKKLKMKAENITVQKTNSSSPQVETSKIGNVNTDTPGNAIKPSAQSSQSQSSQGQNPSDRSLQGQNPSDQTSQDQTLSVQNLQVKTEKSIPSNPQSIEETKANSSQLASFEPPAKPGNTGQEKPVEVVTLIPSSSEKPPSIAMTPLLNSEFPDDYNEMETDMEAANTRVEAASGALGGTSPVEHPLIDLENGNIITTGKFVNAEDSHFFPYFLFASFVLIIGYVIFHNKNKVLGLLLEGRRGDTRRRCPGGGPAYRKLDCTLEEAVSSAPPSHNPHIVY